MGFKKIMLVLIFILAILTIGSVSAADDNATSLTVGEDLILESSNDEILTTNESVGTFSELSTLISTGSVLELEKDYQNDGSVSSEGISISKSITIDGKGHTLDANMSSRIFYLKGNFVLKNIIFKNTNQTSDGGGAIYSETYSNNNLIENCTFINCNAAKWGGAIYLTSGSSESNYNVFNIKNCNFVNCSSQYSGGAIFLSSDFGETYTNLHLDNSTFINCSGSAGGAFFNSNDVKKSIFNINDFINCTFIGCSADSGGAIYNSQDVVNCSFVNCSASRRGGAVLWGNDNYQGKDINGAAYNSSFVNCSANLGGAICILDEDNGNIDSCIFENCSATGSGGAIYITFSYDYTGMEICTSDNYTVSSSDFVNCSASENGGAIYWNGENGILNNSLFDYSTSNSNGGAVYWEGNNGRIINSNFTNSRAKNGGAIYLNETNTLTVSNSIFEYNTADKLGSAVYGANISDCNFSGNSYPETYSSSQPKFNTTTVVSANGTELYLGEGISITVNVFNQNNQIIEGIVDLYVNSELIGAKTIGETFVYVPNETGNYLIEARFNETFNYSSSFNSTSFIVLPVQPAAKNQTRTIILVNSSEVYLGDNIAITVSVLDLDNETLNGNVEVFVNSASIGPKTIGEAFIYTPNDVGNYLIEARFNETSNYNASSNNISFTVLPKSNGNESSNVTPLNPKNETRTMLLVYSANVYLGDNVTVTAIVSNQNSEMLAGTVDVYVNSTFIGSKNINEAFAYAPDKLGKYVIEARFNETSDYNASSASVSVNVIENVVPEEITSDDDGIIVLEFPDDAEGEVEVFIDGVSVEVVKIVNGIAVIDLSKYKGNYTVSFVYSGDDKYSGFTRESNVTVNVNTAIITAKNTKVLYTAGDKFSVTVYEDENVAAKSTPVEFKVNGKYFKTYNTNANGVASFKVTQTPGTYNVQVTALGKTVTKTLTVKHLVTLKKVTVKRSAKKLVLTATLAKVNKKYLKNKKITFKFNSKKYTAKTNKMGVAKVTIKSSVLKKLKAGKKITYQATYLKDTVKQTVKVKK